MTRLVPILLATLSLSGCTSVGHLAMVAKSRADMDKLVANGSSHKIVGIVNGVACRQFLFALLPLGDAGIQQATDNALKKVDGDALLDVTITTSLYTYIPVFNIYSHTC